MDIEGFNNQELSTTKTTDFQQLELLCASMFQHYRILLVNSHVAASSTCQGNKAVIQFAKLAINNQIYICYDYLC